MIQSDSRPAQLATASNNTSRLVLGREDYGDHRSYFRRMASISGALKNRRRSDQGFTMIEVLLTVVIIGFFTAVAIFSYINWLDNSRQAVVDSSAAQAYSWVGTQIETGHDIDDINDRLLVSPEDVSEDVSIVVDDNVLSSERGLEFGDVCVEATHNHDRDIRAYRGNCDGIAPSPGGGSGGGGGGGTTPEEVSPTQPNPNPNPGGNTPPDDDDAPGTMEITVRTSQARQEVFLPIQGGASGEVDWGDGTTEDLAANFPSNTYRTPGTYEITVEGTFNNFSWGPNLNAARNNYASRYPGALNTHPKIQRVDRWENTGTTNLAFAFINQNEITHVEEIPQGVVNLMGMFNASGIRTGLEEWNTSSVTNMSFMFNEARSFNGDIGGWNTSSVTNMSVMFRHANVFNQNINSWDVSNVVSMETMFGAASNFNQPLSNWDTGSLVSMGDMFSHATSFNQNINSWDVSQVRTMWGTFAHTGSFNRPLNNWDTSSVVNMNNMFNSSRRFNQNISRWNVSSVGTHNNFSLNSPLSAANLPRF